MRVVICGGGVIGAASAYFLSRRGIDVVVVERTGVACAASGRAGGFLALDWCAASPLDALARRSFALHARLPGEIEGDWGFRRMEAYAGYIMSMRAPRRGGAVAERGWLTDEVVIASKIGTRDTTAIVQPAALTSALMRAAQAFGAEVRLEQVTGVVHDQSGSTVRGVEVVGGTIAADAVIFTLGPWSILAAQWLRLPPVFGQLSPSLVFDTGTAIPAEALFLEQQDQTGEVLTVEVFPRADGTTFVAAFSSTVPIPTDPAHVKPEPGTIERLLAICERVSPHFTESNIVARQACFRPITRDFLPIIGRVPNAEGAYVATGHNVWGILNSLATGEAVAELVADGAAKTIDLLPFDPARLRPSDPRHSAQAARH